MNAPNNPGRDLALIRVAKMREPVHATARAMRRACGMPPSDALCPPLLLTLGQRI